MTTHVYFMKLSTRDSELVSTDNPPESPPPKWPHAIRKEGGALEYEFWGVIDNTAPDPIWLYVKH